MSTSTPLTKLPVGPASPGAANAAPGAGALRAARALSVVERCAVVGTYVLMVAFFCLDAPSTFATSSTLTSVLDQCAVPVILSCGITLILAVGEFDLSFTATLGLGSGLGVVLLTHHGWATAPACAAVVVVALVIGVIVGVLVTVGGASSFIVTLAVGSAVTGLELAFTNNQTIFQGIPHGYANLTTHTFLGEKSPVWLAAIVIAALSVLLHRTRFGRQAQAIGGNPTAAFLAGVRVRRIKIVCFAITATLAGITSIILTSRADSYYPNSSAGFLLNTYAAAFLGAAIGRWRGFTVLGSAFGVLWIITLQTGLTTINAPTWMSSFLQGLVLAAAVLVASRGRRSRA